MLSWLTTCIASLLLLQGCDRGEPTMPTSDGLAVKGGGPIAAAFPNEEQMFWRWEKAYLTLWEPDPLAPPPVPGRALISFHCDGAELAVETDLVISQDVPLSFGPPNVLRLESDRTHMLAQMDGRSSGYTGWAGGRFRPRRSDLESLLRSDFIVVRPLWVGEAAEYSAEGGLAERYPSPPADMTASFLESCTGLPD